MTDQQVSFLCFDKIPSLSIRLFPLCEAYIFVKFPPFLPTPPPSCVCVTHGNFPNNVTSLSPQVKVDVYCGTIPDTTIAYLPVRLYKMTRRIFKVTHYWQNGVLRIPTKKILFRVLFGSCSI